MRLPERDRHFEGAIDYQLNILLRGLKYVKDYRQAIDIGAHVGYWAKNLTKHFKSVVCFEPVKENYECLLENVVNIQAYNCALGSQFGLGKMVNPAVDNSGAWELKEGTEVQIMPLDDFNLIPSFIKIDVQGSEMEVLKGAERTIRLHKPVVVVEAITHNVLDISIIHLLKKYGLEYKELAMKNVIMG